jgi:hypothetical protein
MTRDRTDFVVVMDQTETSGVGVYLSPVEDAGGGFDWPTLVDGETAEQRRAAMLRLQEAAVRSTRWLPDLLRVALYEDGSDYDATTVVHWFSIRVSVEVDSAGTASIEVEGKRYKVEPGGEVERSQRKAWAASIRERNRQAARTLQQAGRGIVRVPSSLTGMVAGSMPAAMSMETRRELVRSVASRKSIQVLDQLSGSVKATETRVSVAWSDLARQRLTDHDEQTRRSRKRRPPGPTATLWLERMAKVDSKDLWSGALDLLQYVSTDAVVSLFACCIEACERGGWFAATPATIARHRGIDPARVSAKQRQAFREHLRLWTEASIEVSPIDATPSSKEGVPGMIYERLPLLTYDRTIGLRGVGEVPVYRLHGDLWQSMHAGKAWLFDRAALSLDMRRHDLHWRIYSRLTGRWSLSWSKQAGLRESGGLVRVRLVDLLDGPGVDWRSIRQERGEDALLRRVETALRDLVDWPVRPLLADARLLRGSGKVEAMEVEASPTPALVDALWVPKERKARPKTIGGST